ncbi:MAG: hypothetical protein ACI9OJ_000757, partial [Myxococcota bacterium]
MKHVVTGIAVLFCVGCGSGSEAVSTGPADTLAESSTDVATDSADADLEDGGPSDTSPLGDTLGASPDVTEPAPVCPACVSAHAQITTGLSQITFDNQMSRVAADSSIYAPLVWASSKATGGDKNSLPGTLPSPGWLGLVGQGRVIAWAGHEGVWTSDDDGKDDNDAFRIRIMDWLRGDGSRITFIGGKQEWLRVDNFSVAVTAAMTAAGVVMETIAVPLTEAALADVDVLVFGNPWGAVSDSELDAIAAWVEKGGALLATGLGWSWPASSDPDADDYPLNRLGKRLGFRAIRGNIDDPAAPAGPTSSPAYVVRPLSEYEPLQVQVLKASQVDVNTVKGLAVEQPGALFVIEGQHMGLALPTESWASLNDPAAALKSLDKVYIAELALAGAVNPPYRGDVVWIVPQDAPDAPWWMHSGNPIVYQTAAAEAEIIADLNANGHPGWGVAHEQGHNMHTSSCGNLFLVDGTGETWPNVFAVWSYLENGWDWIDHFGPDLFAKGHAHHAEAHPTLTA